MQKGAKSALRFCESLHSQCLSKYDDLMLKSECRFMDRPWQIEPTLHPAGSENVSKAWEK